MKKTLGVIISLSLVFLLATCGNERKLNDMMENEESFSGVVQEVNNETILDKVSEQDYLLEFL